MIDLRQDLRPAYRCLWRRPGLTAAAVLVLGIGIGAVTLMFSTLHAVVLKPLPYPDPDRLVWAWLSSATAPRNSISAADYFDYREKADAFESLAAFFVFRPPALVTGGEKAERVTSNYVSANFFSTLGVAPQLGRAFLPEEQQPGAGEVVVLSHRFWKRRLGGDPSASGKTVTLDGVACEIVGVMPAGFDMPTDVDVWFPLEIGARYATGRDNNNFYVIGRLANGVSLDQAQAQVDVIAGNIAAEFPQDRRGYGITLVSLHERFFGSARSTLLMLTALITLVPLVACANIASLFLARAAERRGELAVRFALGASRWRVVRQLLGENLLVALLGGAAGLALTWWGALALRSLAPDALPRLATVGIDGTVLAFALGVSLATVPAFGILPALRGSKGLTESLKAGGGRGNSDRRAGLRNVLVVAQIALSLMLMIASGLFFRSYQRLTSVDPGFRAESLLTFQLQLPFFEFDTPEELDQAWSGIHEKLRALPGTTAVGAVDRLPISGNAPTNFVHAADRPPASQEDQRTATRRFASEGFFQALGAPLLSGRAFEAADRPGSPPVVVINETLARQFFSADASLVPLRGDPLGRTLVLPKWDPPVHLEVVGVVADVAERGPGLEPPPIFYMAARQRPGDAMRFLLRTEEVTPEGDKWGNPLALAATLSRVVKEVHADVAVSQVSTMEARLADSLAQPRFRTTLVGLFALVSLIMAAVGLYGVLVCIVRQRGRELGIRLALGAQARDVFALIVGRGMALVGIGIGLGLAGAFAGTRIIRSLLFDIVPTDAPTFGAVSICLGLVALAACLEPAWRAMRIDPCEALRAE